MEGARTAGLPESQGGPLRQDGRLDSLAARLGRSVQSRTQLPALRPVRGNEVGGSS